ncbi:MAG: hypothetical protein IPP71_22810 [Bacteroidetes bacterium]|nr:hypothetical protein [Bacteroidota bacterium]
MNPFVLLLILFCIVSSAKSQPTFSTLSSGIQPSSGGVRTICYDTTSNILYAAGGFHATGDGVTALRVAQWDGVSWDSVGSGAISGIVGNLVMFDGQIYAGGGVFSTVGGIVAKGCSRWDGNNWYKVADFTENSYASVYGLNVIDNELYVLGGYNFIDSTIAYGISKFDGISLTIFPILEQVPNSGYVVCAAKFNNELYIGGNFNGGTGKKDIAKFDGNNWVSVGGGFSGGFTWVNDMIVYQNKLYIAGYFQVSGGDPGNGIVCWDGSNWCQAGTGLLPSNVWNLHEFGGELYACGQINNAGGISVTSVAKWDGSNWYDLGSFFDNSASAFASNSNDLFIGGGFITIDGDTMNGITKYTLPVGIEENESIVNEIEILFPPTPPQISLTSNQTTVSYIKFNYLIFQERW